MKIAKESIVAGMTIVILILMGPMNVYAKNSPSASGLTVAVELPAYPLQHLPTMQQNLEHFYQSVS